MQSRRICAPCMEQRHLACQSSVDEPHGPRHTEALRGMGTTVVLAVCGGQYCAPCAHAGRQPGLSDRMGRSSPSSPMTTLWCRMLRGAGRDHRGGALRPSPAALSSPVLLGVDCDDPGGILPRQNWAKGTALLLCSDGLYNYVATADRCSPGWCGKHWSRGRCWIHRRCQCRRRR